MTEAIPPHKLPDQIDESGILTGWSLEHKHAVPPIGFHYGRHRPRPDDDFLKPILFEGEGHLMTIAPTGAGKGTGCIIPTLLRHSGPVIVVDPKGENVAVTARQRESLGQKVIILDPMRICKRETDRLNPFDLLDKDSATLVDDISFLTSILLPEEVASRDQFWVSRAQHLLVGFVLHLIHDARVTPTLAMLRNMLSKSDDDLRELGENMMKSQHPDVYAAGAALQLPARETFGGILSHAQNVVDFARGELVQTATENSTFSLDAITRGDPVSVFIVIPPEKLESHRQLLRIWIGVLISAVTRRQTAPPEPTLFIIDEAAQLGSLPQLRQAITLLRGYGLQTWSFWQDVSQIQRLYPLDWQTMVNNCRVLQTFGAANMNAANQVAELTGYPDALEILDLDYDEMILLIGGDEAVIAQRPNYLQDPVFHGRYDSNPRHQQGLDIMPKPRRPKRVYQRTPRPSPSLVEHPVSAKPPLWSTLKRNAINEVTGMERFSGGQLRAEIEKSLKGGRLRKWPLPPLIEGDWKVMDRNAAANSLYTLWPNLQTNFGYGLQGIDAVRELQLPFLEGVWLREARCYDANGFAGYLCYLASALTHVQLNGGSAPIHQMNAIHQINLRSPEATLDYFAFFCAAVQGEHGPFRLVTKMEDLVFQKDHEANLDPDTVEKIKTPTIEAAEDPTLPYRWRTTSLIHYGSALFEANFKIHDSGMIEMENDEMVQENLPLMVDSIINGLRSRRKFSLTQSDAKDEGRGD